MLIARILQTTENKKKRGQCCKMYNMIKYRKWLVRMKVFHLGLNLNAIFFNFGPINMI